MEKSVEYFILFIVSLCDSLNILIISNQYVFFPVELFTLLTDILRKRLINKGRNREILWKKKYHGFALDIFNVYVLYYISHVILWNNLIAFAFFAKKNTANQSGKYYLIGRNTEYEITERIKSESDIVPFERARKVPRCFLPETEMEIHSRFAHSNRGLLKVVKVTLSYDRCAKLDSFISQWRILSIQHGKMEVIRESEDSLRIRENNDDFIFVSTWFSLRR